MDDDGDVATDRAHVVSPNDSLDPSAPVTAATTSAIVVGSLAVATVAALDPSGWFPFSVAKWWAVVVTALLGAALAAARIDPRRERSREARKGTVLVVALTVVVTASAVTGVDGVSAWIGTPVRHLGALTWWLFATMFVVGTTLSTSTRSADRDARLVAGALTLVALLLGGYVLWESVGGRPVGFVTSSDRLAGPYGSSAYLGACCCLLLPAAIGLAAPSDAPRVVRIVAIVAATGVALGLVGSGSRAALVGLGLAGGAATIVLVRSRSAAGPGARTVPICLRLRTALAAAGLGAGAYATAAWFAVSRGVFERSSGWSTRLDEWELAVRVIARRPLLGHGPEGYRIAAFSAVDDDYVRRFGEEALVDRAHSGILDVAATSGVVAAALYAAVLVFVVRRAFSVVRIGSSSERGLAVSVIAYALGQQFLFPIAEIDPLFWLLAGFVVASPRDHTGPGTGVSADDVVAERGARATRGSALTVASVLVVVAIASAVAGTRAVAADRLAADAAHGDDPTIAVASSRRAEDLAPFDVRHPLHTARLSAGLATLSGVDDAIEAVERAVAISPNDPAVRIERARLLSLRATVTGDTIDRDRAERVWAELLVDAPSCARCHLGSALAAGERGDFDRAQIELERAADLGSADAIDRLGR